MTIDAALLSQLAQTIRKHCLFQPNDTLIVALSGGADSTALLDLLIRLPGYDLRLVSAHLNHCLRGAESDADEEFCRKLAAGHGIPLEISRVDVKVLAESKGLNLEDAGRRARIAFLDSIREKHGAAAIVTAHHGDDQAETVLMRLLRGSGMTGLSGMPYRNRRGCVRPLLDVSRAQIEQYLAERGLDWREDASNLDTSFLRNRIRHELLPLLEQYNPAIRLNLTATAAILADEDALLEGLAEQAFDSSWRTEGGAYVCSIAEFKAHPPALQRRILRHVCRRLAGNLEGFNLGHIESIRQLLDSPRPNSRIALPQNISALREYDRVVLRFSAEPSLSVADDIVIATPGHYPLPGGGMLAVEICPAAFNLVDLPADRVCFDLDRTPFPWRVRTFRPGDRMVPFGMTGRKKVKDIFIDAKLPLSERRTIPLLFCCGELLWIAGLRRADSGRVIDTSTTIAKVSYIRD
ncbi:MAG: tRNA lysidine(34) synthetase TilS [Steroidobacteraceae bacterium]|nr:tRNA lysidine(34) synthetase TilS [Deltaproteobacteria bacterium]